MKTSLKKLRVGFTLIELLVVIAIIAILAAMLLPAINKAKLAAVKARAMNEINDIATALARYEDAYSQLPTIPSIATGTDDFTFGLDPIAYPQTPAPPPITMRSTNSDIIAILMDVENFRSAGSPKTVNYGHAKNPTKIPFLNAKPATDNTSPGVGLDGNYRDPWGNPYIISLDYSFDDQCRDAFYARNNVSQKSGLVGFNGLQNQGVAGSDKFTHSGKIMVWSLGPDGKADINTANLPAGKADKGLNQDNLLSWK